MKRNRLKYSQKIMIAIIGKIPPPIGGVTIYVSRLIENLSRSNESYCFIQLTLINLVLSIYKLRGCLIVHLIASNPFVRLYYAILCIISGKKLIITYTDNIGEFPNLFYNFINNLSLKLATAPTVLNIDSFNTGKMINNKTRLISSFIPPSIDDVNPDKLRVYLDLFLAKYKIVFCTNAFNYCLDKSGNEIYGIIKLISIFNCIPNFGLIISDPSGAYIDYTYKNGINCGSNIKFLSVSEFSFINVIKLSDCVIRATTTDGDSLSIREALYLNKDVICSDCVSRPVGCLVYATNDDSSLVNMVKNYKQSEAAIKPQDNQNGLIQILHIYHELMTNPIH